jgi:hypothetical protein
MTKDGSTSGMAQQPPKPNPALKRLEKLIGTWDLRGHTLDSAEDNITGWNTIEWLPGGFFLKSTGEIVFKGVLIQSLEIIGYDPSTGTFPSSVYSNLDGTVPQYEWNVQGSVVMHSDPTSIYTGTLSEDGQTLVGGWRPKAGEKENPENSYDAVMTRVR